MEETNQDELGSENQAIGGETDVNQTTEIDYQELAEKNAQIADDQRKRAEIAEAKLKAKPEVKAPAPIQQTNTDVLSREEAILIAQGMQPEDIDELKAVAKAKELSLLKAKETPLFQGYLEKQEADRKKEKARLSTSKGSQVTQTQSVADLDDDAHKALVKETLG